MLREASRVATVCAVFAGAVTGSVWTLGPVLGRALGLEPSEIGLLMSAAIIGGAVTQFPVGRLSDVTDRRFVIGGMALIGSLVSVVGWRFAGSLDLALYSAMFMLGAASMPLYSLCIAHASDRTCLTLVEVTSSVLIMNSIGSIIAPAIVAVLMDAFGPSSFFAVAAVSMLMAAIWTFHRALVVERRPHAVEHAALLPRTTQAIAELSTHGERH
jgi:MFS family permease